MPLGRLIICRTVCKEWRRLVLVYVDQDFDRLRLQELFETIAKSSRPTRLGIGRYPRRFNREVYINALLSQSPIIPDAFRLWVLEWPANVVRPGQWPDNPPVVSTHSLDARLFPDLQSVRMLSIQEAKGRYAFHNTWLILDENPQYLGRVLVVRRKYKKLRSDPDGHFDVDSQCEIYDDWIQYQRTLWDQWDGYEHIPMPPLTGADSIDSEDSDSDPD